MVLSVCVRVFFLRAKQFDLHLYLWCSRQIQQCSQSYCTACTRKTVCGRINSICCILCLYHRLDSRSVSFRQHLSTDFLNFNRPWAWVCTYAVHMRQGRAIRRLELRASKLQARDVRHTSFFPTLSHLKISQIHTLLAVIRYIIPNWDTVWCLRCVELIVVIHFYLPSLNCPPLAAVNVCYHGEHFSFVTQHFQNEI